MLFTLSSSISTITAYFSSASPCFYHFHLMYLLLINITPYTSTEATILTKKYAKTEGNFSISKSAEKVLSGKSFKSHRASSLSHHYANPAPYLSPAPQPNSLEFFSSRSVIKTLSPVLLQSQSHFLRLLHHPTA